MTPSIGGIPSTLATSRPDRGASSLDREVASRMFGSYADSKGIAARRRGEVTGGGAFGTVPAVEMAAQEVPQQAAVSSRGRSPVDRGSRAGGQGRLSAGVEKPGAPRQGGDGARATVPAEGRGANGNQSSPAGVSDAGSGQAMRGAVGASGGALARLSGAGSGLRASVGSSSGSGGNTRAAGGSSPVGIGAQRLRVGATSTAQRAQSARPAARDALIEQIQRGLARALQSKDGEVTVRLRPENLGLVKVQIRVEGSHVTASLEATSEQARELLSQNIVTLERALEARGLSVDRVVVEHVPASVTDDGSRESREQWGGASTREFHGRSPSEPDAERSENEQVSAAWEWHGDTIHIDAIA